VVAITHGEVIKPLAYFLKYGDFSGMLKATNADCFYGDFEKMDLEKVDRENVIGKM
jgi:hypothetical protein